MAGTMMHLAIADRLIETLNIENIPLFLCGNLAPDAIMARANYTREMKRHTHFKDGIRLHELKEPESYRVYRRRLQEFYDQFVRASRENRELYLGYVTHMLVDELYIFRLRDRHVERLLAAGKAPDDGEYFAQYGRESDSYDYYLAMNYEFPYPMPDTLRLEHEYEIPGFITHEEIEDSKNFVIHKYYEGPRVILPDGVMTRAEHDAFFRLAVEQVPQMLRGLE